MRPTKGELRLAASSVRIARRRLLEYADGGGLVHPSDLYRIESLLRRALELLGTQDYPVHNGGSDG